MFMKRDFLGESDEEEFSEDENMPPPLMDLMKKGQDKQPEQQQPQVQQQMKPQVQQPQFQQQTAPKTQQTQFNPQQNQATYAPQPQIQQQKKQAFQNDFEDSFESQNQSQNQNQNFQQEKYQQAQVIRPQETEIKPKQIQTQKIQQNQPQNVVATFGNMNIKDPDPDFQEIASSSFQKQKQTQQNIQDQQKMNMVKLQQEKYKQMQQQASVTGIVSSHNERPSTAQRKMTPIEEMLNSNAIPYEKDLAQNKQLASLSGKTGAYDPSVVQMPNQMLPANLKSEKKVIKSELEANEGKVVIQKQVMVPAVKEEVIESQQNKNQPKVIKQQQQLMNRQQFGQQNEEEEEEDQEEEEEEEDEEQKQVIQQQERLKKEKAAKLQIQANEIPQEPQITKQEEKAQNMQRLYEAMQDMRRFVMNPVPPGIMLQATIRRDRSGLKRF